MKHTPIHRVHLRKAVVSAFMLVTSVGFFGMCALAIQHAFSTGNGDGAGAAFLFLLGTLYLIGVYSFSVVDRYKYYKQTKPTA